jgi:alginate O-acetyltransferase complex protein AlgI
MSFVSFTFLVFLAAVVVLYYIVPKRFQWVLLLAASYGFYLSCGLKAMLFMISTTVIVFAGALRMQNVKDSCDSHKEAKKRNKKVLVLEVLLNFGILLALKYYNFAAENISALFGMFNYSLDMPLVNIALPLGISFYTFQAVGYTIDVYKNKYDAERNFFRFALFISFFPQMTQGPISRYDDLAPQLAGEHAFCWKEVRFGIELILWGYFKKMVIADRAGIIVSQVFGSSGSYDGLQIFTAMVVYAIQIYTDFSGGIDIARGAAQMMGIHLVDNFRQPYFGDSVAEYWRRWHMSLTNWMRDYVFFPLTLSKFSNRLGKWGRRHFGKIGKQIPAYLPTFVTFTLIGIWHGAAWGFIAYGLYNSIIIILSMMLTPAFTKWKAALHIDDSSFGWKVWCIIRTFLIMVYGKTLTRAGSVHEAFSMMKKTLTMFASSGSGLLDLGLGGREIVMLILSIAVLFTVSVLRERGMNIRESLDRGPLPRRWALTLGLLAVVLVFGVYGEGYSASSFVYRNY